MANEPFAPPSNKRSRYSGAIADVNLDAFQGILAIMNEDEIRRVENPSAPSAYAISDGRGKNGMFDWERFECNPTNFYWCSLVDDVAIFERGMLQFLPSLLGCIHRTRRAAFQSPRLICVRVCEHYRVRMQPLKFSQPIEAAIDHHIRAAVRHHERGMHAMPSGPVVDLAARAEECQFHL
jgi:hypothetical protein